MKLARRDVKLLSSVLSVIVLGGLYWFLIKPARANVSAKQTTIEQTRQDVARLRDDSARLGRQRIDPARVTSESLRLSKAIPVGAQIPGAILELQRAADLANVRIEAIRSDGGTDYGGLRSEQLNVQVSGAFFDVDDFLYRIHRQVGVGRRGTVTIRGRIFVTTSVQLTLDASATDTSVTSNRSKNRVIATLSLILPYSPSASDPPVVGGQTPASASTSPTGGAAANGATR